MKSEKSITVTTFDAAPNCTSQRVSQKEIWFVMITEIVSLAILLRKEIQLGGDTRISSDIQAGISVSTILYPDDI